jgi:hypothetical protein
MGRMSEIKLSSAPQFRAAWELSRLALIEGVLGREPTDEEIADHLRGDGSLRWIAGIEAETPIAALISRRRSTPRADA